MQVLKNKKIGILGFGSQGSAQARNLKDGGFEVKIGLRPGSANWQSAIAESFDVLPPADLAKYADVLVFLTPDETHGETFERDVKDNFKKGGTLIFAHGFSINFGLVTGFLEMFNVGLVSPKAVGKAVRQNFLEKKGIACLVCAHYECSPGLGQILDEYAGAIGAKRVIKTTVKTECETDLFSEQTVLCGGVIELMQSAFDTLVEAGYDDEIAYFECVYELKLIVDLIAQKGIRQMYGNISNAAKFGGFKVGRRIIDNGVKQKMRGILSRIQSGVFAEEFLRACKEDYGFKKEIERKYRGSRIERAGEGVLSNFGEKPEK